MKLAKHRHIRRTAALFVLGTLAAILLLISLPDTPQRSQILSSQSVRAADQMSFMLSEPLVLSREPHIVVERGTIALAEPEGVAPLTAGAAKQLLESGRGILVLKDAELAIGHRSASKTATDTTISDDQPEAPLAKALVAHKFRNLIVEDGDLRFAPFPGAPRLGNVKVHIRPVPGSRMSVQGSFDLLGRSVQVETTFGLNAADKPAGNVPIRGTLRSEGIFDSFFSGQFVNGDGGRLLADASFLEIKDVPVLARWLGLAWPRELGLKAFRADGRMEWAGAVLNMPDGRFKLDGNAATGSLLINGRGARPLIDGTLAFNQFDADQLIAGSDDAHETTLLGTMQSTANWLPHSVRQVLTELHLPILRQIDIDLRASAQSTKAGALQFGRTAAALSLHDGRVVLDIAEMELQSGGQGSLQFSLDTHRPISRCGVRGKFLGVRVEKLAQTVLRNELLVGPADVSFELAGDWKDPERLLSTLDGRIDLTMANGAKLEGDLRELIDQRKLDAEPQEGWGKVAQGETYLRSVDATLLFSAGVGKVDRLHAQRRDERKLAVTGTVDVRDKRLDLKVFANDDSATSEGSSVLRIDGRWDAPTLMRRSLPNKAENPLYPVLRDDGLLEGQSVSTPRRG